MVVQQPTKLYPAESLRSIFRRACLGWLRYCHVEKWRVGTIARQARAADPYYAFEENRARAAGVGVWSDGRLPAVR